MTDSKAAAPEGIASGWQPIETAPNGYEMNKGFRHVLFYGTSAGRSFNGGVIISGWMDSDRKPVYYYQYKLRISHWMPLLAPPGATQSSQEGTQAHVRVQRASNRVSESQSHSETDRGVGPSEAAADRGGHEQNCPALDFYGDYRAVIYEDKCLCPKRWDRERAEVSAAPLGATAEAVAPTAASEVLRELDSYRAAIRDAFEEGFSLGRLDCSLAKAWEGSDARQAEWAFAHTRISVGAVVRHRQVAPPGAEEPAPALRRLLNRIRTIRNAAVRQPPDRSFNLNWQLGRFVDEFERVLGVGSSDLEAIQQKATDPVSPSPAGGEKK